MQVSMSKYLTNQKKTLKKLIEILLKDFKYASVLGTDIGGKTYSVYKTGASLNDSEWAERGFVVRVHNGYNYSEYSFNELSEAELGLLVENIKNKVNEDINNLKVSGIKTSTYPVIEEDKIAEKLFKEVGVLPEEVSAEEKIGKMTKIKNEAFTYSNLLVDFRINYEECHISKIFISQNKDLEQSYIWSQGSLSAVVRKDDNTKFYYDSEAGLKGVEILDELQNKVKEVVSYAEKLLDAKKIIPGEYDVICSPGISGLIAHEAFGHGVEMDMFVKNRAKAAEFINREVASELVIMHDGAAAAENVSSYLFDDEGVLGTDTIIIEKGILKTGISDLLSALRLGTSPTGNGKRESFERKAYARMTNTFFAGGNNKLEDMIASIKEGYLLDVVLSGMEDPKNWGIQCMILVAKEIKDGKLTGNIMSPVIVTGYVPDVLKSISMVSEEVEIFGSGACGKGYKEWVKAADGGPYIKARVRLG
ncbi:TldD/PmbA family protein [Proteiniborus sp. MB09-C3]|uniref:TldD/PmbA family protein n=1 Tax=Proteiniborus sp. MB09-C3 TaxID=3050072 RepID=UPI0025531B85|nr:TldD/PmbA family protein [Proteiniborus sp. MB09-C3]WIV11752.1 TldD/PmbA family protein [Proteiniborus sp. MB09-C3]